MKDQLIRLAVAQLATLVLRIEENSDEIAQAMAADLRATLELAQQQEEPAKC